MKPGLLFFCVIYVLGAVAQPFAPPYKLSTTIDVPVSANAITLLGTSLLISTTHNLPQKENIRFLNRDSVNRFDRGLLTSIQRLRGT